MTRAKREKKVQGPLAIENARCIEIHVHAMYLSKGLLCSLSTFHSLYFIFQFHQKKANEYKINVQYALVDMKFTNLGQMYIS